MDIDISQRKLRHIEACLLPEAAYQTVKTGLERLSWPYRALPETSLEHISLETPFLGKRLNAPILIGAMTGGAEKGRIINRNLAMAAQHLGLGLMLGSQRVMLENRDARSSFQVRDLAPDIVLIGNLGAVQLLLGYGPEQIARAVEGVGADALALHVNPLQEALQKGGDTDWRGLLERLHQVVPQCSHPIVLKEVGHGLSGEMALAVKDVGFAALDVAGAGGTSWARVEQLVHQGRVSSPDLCELGIPTARALKEVRSSLPTLPLIASGGVYSGLEMAKSLALGASVVALARPLLAPALESAEAVIRVLEGKIRELKMALFIAGCSSLADLAGLELEEV